MAVFVRSAYNYDRDEASNASGLQCKDASRAIQSQKDAADINNIVKKFGITGQIVGKFRMPLQGDFEGVTDFRSAMERVVMAKENFMRVPANVRSRFNNDPGEFASFCLLEKNRDQLVEWGLAPKREAKGIPVPVTP